MSWETFSGSGKPHFEHAGLGLGLGSAGAVAGLSRWVRPAGTRGSAGARGRSGTHRQGPGPPEGLPDGVCTAAGSGTPLHRGDAQPRLTHRLSHRRPGSRHPHTHPPTRDTHPAVPGPRPGPTPPAAAAAPLSASVQDGATPRRPLRGALTRPRRAPRPRPASAPRPRRRASAMLAAGNGAGGRCIASAAGGHVCCGQG